jgi:hypothetical protein
MPLNLSGQLSLLRVHELGSRYGPQNDQLDVEVIVQFAGRPNDAFGFQLRTDENQPVREGMLALLRDGFNRGWTVWIDYNIDPGKHNGTIVRVWLTKPVRGFGGGVIGGVLETSISSQP